MRKGIFFGLLAVLFISCLAKTETGQAGKVEIKDGEIILKVQKEGFKFSFLNADGTTLVPAGKNSGLSFSGGAVVQAEELVANSVSGDKVFLVTNTYGDKAKVAVSFINGIAKFSVTPEIEESTQIKLSLGGMDVAHGLGDAAAYEEAFNIVDNEKDEYLIKNDGGGRRWASTFAIFPQNNLAGVFFDKGRKTVVLNKDEYSMDLTTAGEATFYYLLGSPKTIYTNYKTLRGQQGYTDVKPKFRLFELGWESWDALGWNTNQETVREILEKFHRNNYPIRWAVTGSGFWDQGGTTTSFGRWGEKFSEAMSFKNWMHNQDIKWMIGLRTNFIPEGGPYYPKTKKRDKNLKVNSFYGNELTTEAKENGYLVTNKDGDVLSLTSGVFPIVPSHLLNGDAPGAAQWYQQQYQKWEIDGIKEDTMMKLDSLTGIYNAPVNEIANKGGLVMARNGEFTALGTLLRINDTGVGELSRRIPINYMQYAASGFPNVYSDVAGVHNMNKLNDIDRNIRHTWLLSLTAGLAVGAYPEKWPKEKQKIFKEALNFHYTLAPYMFSAASKGFESGFPTTLTPMTLAFPEDGKTAELDNHQWMIGESLLAAPLLKDIASGKMDVYLPKGEWYDYDSGKKYTGPLTLKDFEMPLDKTPCFIGGKGIVVLREADQLPLMANIYPIQEVETSFTFVHPDGNAKSVITYKAWNAKSQLTVLDTALNEKIPFTRDAVTGSITFEIHPNHNYNIIEE